MTRWEHARENPTDGGRNGRSASSGPRLKLVAVVGILALALGACGTGDAPTPDSAAGIDGHTVVIEDLSFEPDTLTVETGDTVTWVWNDGPSNTTCPEKTSTARSCPKVPSATASTSPAPTATSARCTRT
jgi:plastocyanin